LCYRRGNIGETNEKIDIKKILENYSKWLKIYNRNRSSDEIVKLIDAELKPEKFLTNNLKKKCGDTVNINDSDEYKDRSLFFFSI